MDIPYKKTFKTSFNIFQNSKEKHIWYIIQKYLSKYLKNGMNIIGVIELEKITPDTGASFSFILISEIYIFSFEYKFKEEKLTLLKNADSLIFLNEPFQASFLYDHLFTTVDSKQ